MPTPGAYPAELDNGTVRAKAQHCLTHPHQQAAMMHVKYFLKKCIKLPLFGSYYDSQNMLLFVVGPQYTVRNVGNDVNTLGNVLY